MSNRLFKNILYFIIATIVLTLAVQVYWNFKNYEKNLQNFQNDVQISLDNGLENYYAILAEKNHMTFIDLDAEDRSPETIIKMLDTYKMDSLAESIKEQMETNYDSITQIIEQDGVERALTYSKKGSKLTNLKIIRGKKAADSIKLLKNITSIYISIQDDSLKLTELSPFIKKELNRKQLDIPFSLKFRGKDSIETDLNAGLLQDDLFKTDAKSKFLKEKESLTMLYPNATAIVLREGLSGILLSVILVLGVIACLLYLLKIIKNQKELAEVKNDLISNITHEFKTPIATIGVALESIKDFNGIDDRKKTMNYLDMSSNQLSKLNVMVEKLLETATLDSENLELNKEVINISELLEQMVEKHNLQKEGKPIKYIESADAIEAQVDVFHFENAINNILDNAIKYGGEEVSILLEQHNEQVLIAISDSGTTLKKSNKEKIFEKFYRVPKGNTHDVKVLELGYTTPKKSLKNTVDK